MFFGLSGREGTVGPAVDARVRTEPELPLLSIRKWMEAGWTGSTRTDGRARGRTLAPAVPTAQVRWEDPSDQPQNETGLAVGGLGE